MADLDVFEKIAQARAKAVSDFVRGMRPLVERISLTVGLAPETTAALACEAAAIVYEEYCGGTRHDILRWILDTVEKPNDDQDRGDDGIVYE